MTGFAYQRERASGLSVIVHDVVTESVRPWRRYRTAVADALSALTRGMGLAYFAFLEGEEADLITDVLQRSDDPENALSHHPAELARLVSKVRANGYATRSSLVEPRNSNTIAVPIIGNSGEVPWPAWGLTYFTSAFPSEQEACARYAPVLLSAASAIAEDLKRLSRSIWIEVDSPAIV